MGQMNHDQEYTACALCMANPRSGINAQGASVREGRRNEEGGDNDRETETERDISYYWGFKGGNKMDVGHAEIKISNFVLTVF